MVEIGPTFKAIKSSFKMSYDTQTFYQGSNLCCFLVSVSVLFHLMCDYIYLVSLDRGYAIYLCRAAHMFSLLCPFQVLVVFPLMF